MAARGTQIRVGVTLPRKRRTAPLPPHGDGSAAAKATDREKSQKYLLPPASVVGDRHDETMACCRALALQLLSASAPSRTTSASRARVSVPRRRRASSIRCCADQGEPPQDAVLKAISQIASSKGRVAQTTNVIMGGTVTDDATDEWLVLDKKPVLTPQCLSPWPQQFIVKEKKMFENEGVNSYPTVRGFTAIGTGGDDFVQSMVVAVESVIQERIPEGQISQKISSKGKYISVKIGPIRVVSSEQVKVVYVEQLKHRVSLAPVSKARKLVPSM
ncbi:hypothetical protein EJB05_21582, partial [Eragrostis curvula]